jgi:hypothetical protein
MVIDDIDDLIADGVDGLQVGAAVWLIGKHLTVF